MSTPADPTASAVAELAADVDLDSVADANDLRDAGDADDTAGARTELPLEADPADVAEQDAAVPFDDEER
jgi:hypothetical protein